MGANLHICIAFTTPHAWTNTLHPFLRYNVRRRLEKKAPLTEEAFEAVLDEQQEVGRRRGARRGCTGGFFFGGEIYNAWGVLWRMLAGMACIVQQLNAWRWNGVSRS